jgi:hypothetical protein
MLSSFEFNPMTGQFDLVGKSSRYKVTQVVDASFLLTPEITLQKEPKPDSEVVSLNGLEIDDSNYSISGNVLTMVTTELLETDILYVNFIG